jgi:hypothetical protein
METLLKAQPLKRLAKYLHNLAVLGQSKAYLYRRSDWQE